jgi:serine/threonine protein kinase/tetratricopeptide (TPR) repeat protein
MTEQAQAVEAIFLAALDKPTPAERRAYVEGACAGNAELLGRVRELLVAHEGSQGPLDAPPDFVGTVNVPPLTESAGTVIGPYKLLQQIGEGGMGTVWMAEQSRPVQRKVALKVVKPGMDSRLIIGRFEQERQALALMDHPNIAKVLDAGTTESGRPYFVMELVKGVPITRYCDERRLTPKERLELFVPVCQAVQHAHTKGIIHRDLKPSNVLIALYDGKAVPKVIDFGVAKATGPKLTERTLFTEFGAVVGTLEYMSPEQAELNQLDIDTRSDVYSLGVLLYELLTGTTPIEHKRLKESSLLEVLRLIREEEPPRPSTRLSTAEELPVIAAKRGAEPRKLRGLVRGELDWIVMKCLEKDRDRRYETANGLARDIQRCLHDEPVQACPPSAAYRFRKFARRNKRLLAPAVAAVLALAASSVWIWRERQEAIRQRDEAREQRRQAEVNFRKARQAVEDYFVQVSQNDLLLEPSLEPLRKQFLKMALDYYKEFVQEHRDDPGLQADLAVTYLRIARLMHDLNLEEDWLASFEKFLAIVEGLLPEGAGALVAQSGPASMPWITTGVGFHVSRPADALRAFTKARDIWEELVQANPAVPGLRNDLALFYLVIAFLRAHQPAEAVPAYRKACALWQELSQAHPEIPYYRAPLAVGLGNLGIAQSVLEQFPQAEESCRQALAIATKIVDDFPNVAVWQDVRSNLTCLHYATVLERAHRPRDAEPLWRQAVDAQEALRKRYPTVPRFQSRVFALRLNLAEVLWATGRSAQAAQEYRQALTLAAEFNPDDAAAQDDLAGLLATCPDRQFRDPRRALAIAKKNTEQAPHVAGSWITAGIACYRLGDWPAAVQALERGAELSSGHTFCWLYLAMAHGQMGERDQARKCYDRAVDQMKGHNLDWQELYRTRAEAEEVLGIAGANR